VLEGGQPLRKIEMAKFRVPAQEGLKPESPALLFRDLQRDPNVKFLWDHQARLLEEYHQAHLKTSDLAVELPTGSGKTLVALLIAEFRRRSFGERVVFLCPTRQLCSQVAAQTQSYGLRPALLVGPQKSYDPAVFSAYQQAKAIAITTYSGVFNAKPEIDDAQLIICDDAHAAENYVSSPWTVTINRRKDNDAFQALFGIIRPELSDNVLQRIETFEPAHRSSLVELISPISLYNYYSRVRQALNDLDRGKDWGYAWRRIVDHLEACSVYCSAEEFEIRPVVAPTLTHAAFASAKQRLYMSATLGEDGDTERAFGVEKIEQLPIPKGWDKRGTGRRLVLFPGYGADDDETWETVVSLINETSRALVLVPDDRVKERVTEKLKDEFPILGAADIEGSLQPFTGHAGKVVLIMANRWEGTDLPGDACRLLIMVGLPAGAGLQERFLMERLGAVSQLRDRLRTRVTQAIGRCTRDEADFSIVLMLGNDLLKWCCTSANIRGMHPELQAEIDFGLENSEDRSSDDFVELARDFLSKSADWRQAEDAIVAKRNSLTRVADDTAAELRNAAPAEIAFVYRMWNGEFDSALQQPERAIEALAGGDNLRPYRSFWHHQAAIAAFFTFKSTSRPEYKEIAIRHLQLASTTSLGIRVLGEVRAKLSSLPVEEGLAQEPVREWFSHINAALTEWKLRGARFEREIAALRELLAHPEKSDGYERGLELLGRMLGAKTHRWNEDGAPDGMWLFENFTSMLFEAKQEKAEAIALKTVRQARTHEERARHDKLIPAGVSCTTVIVSRQAKLDRLGIPHAADLRKFTPQALLEIFERATRALREVRTFATTLTEEALQLRAEQIYRGEKVFLTDIVAQLSAARLVEMPST
jgi:hypothetical protein